MWEIIEAIMKQRNMNVVQLAHAASIPPSTVYSWKSGKITPAVNKLAKVAKVLDVSVDYLMGRTTNPKVSSLETEYQLLQEKFAKDAIPQNFKDIYTDLTDENKDLLLDFAKLLLSRQK